MQLLDNFSLVEKGNLSFLFMANRLNYKPVLQTNLISGVFDIFKERTLIAG